MTAIRVLQFICPTGFYGAERWILALTRNTDSTLMHNALALSREPWQEENELSRQFEGNVTEIKARSRFSFSVIFALRKLIKEQKIDIIHTHGYKSDILGLIAARLCGIRCVSTPHGFGEVHDMALLRRTYHHVGMFCLRFFDSVVPLSKDLYAEVKAGGVPEEKIVYIPNGVDFSTENHSPSSISQSLPHSSQNSDFEKPFTVGFVGQMIKRKRVFDLLDVFDSVKQSGRNINFVLVGDGRDKADLERHAATLESKDSIHFVGFQSDGASYIKDFDMFVMASSQEGIPRALMESMAAGTPVVAYDIPGVDQLLVNGDTGLLAPYGDKDILKNQWCNMIDDPAMAKEIAVKAKEFIFDNYSGSRLANNYTEHFQKLLQESSTGSAA